MKYKWNNNSQEKNYADKFKDITVFNCKCGGRAKMDVENNNLLNIFVSCLSCNAHTGFFREPHRAASQWNSFVGSSRYNRHTPGIKFNIPAPLDFMSLNKNLDIKNCNCESEADLIIHDHKQPLSSIKCRGCGFETGIKNSPQEAKNSWDFI